MNIEDKFQLVSKESTDMIEHMPTLKAYAAKCQSVVEFGVYDCTSTWGLLAGLPVWMRSYDIARREEVSEVEVITRDSGVDFQFILGSTLDVTIDSTDLLFIDSYHSYAQLSAELGIHGGKAKKFIILHDTTIFAEVDQDGISPGLWQAVEEFLAKNPVWSIKERFTNCHGLTVLERHP